VFIKDGDSGENLLGKGYAKVSAKFENVTVNGSLPKVGNFDVHCKECQVYDSRSNQ